MQKILILGAGKSSKFLIEYLANSAKAKPRKITVADLSTELAEKQTKNLPQTTGIGFSVDEKNQREKLIKDADVVISMLPAFLHPLIAKDCLKLGKHFFSASYESDELRKLRNDIEEKGLLFLNECGLDPGIDHMSAMQIIDREKKRGNEIISFKSFTGGVLAPESEDNPWKYKFTWNPRNVVLAGQGVSRFIRNGKYKYIPYHMLFRRLEPIKFEAIGEFEGYPNRDSLSYREVYGLEHIPTILRGTLRRAGFCQSWDVFVQLGMTDDSFEMNLPEGFTKRMFVNSFLPYHPEKTVETKIMELLPWVNEEILSKIKWIGLLANDVLPKLKGSPASILQMILEEKWALKSEDKDMIVMQHQFEVKVGSNTKRITSSLICIGEDQERTAMAKTVGLPLALAVELFLDGKIKQRGLALPISPEIYNPLLSELKNQGIIFKETEELLD
ncbi:Saccharopine dehydrogenase [NADP, L-glutamate-forming] [Indibacter alkaliphilus LW1]|uniref:Saccharopine dehydrogenase [NADP, L-glutamate-forming] n=1 Tax=Indibacter alkaliphilus (strain CCUG 57479 / KCTC 22604 / LW1) TaxID=1189612 RepID=S2E559_INDAL|nr:saccharopine dehydrogenase C-terminal domain-containing protein [Indibacter alkaliphilus]EOZ99731.1 Saccharopine dehydrogenase [NADP, L-glutamate-forming] [Indibacter alkaliphilus LW1]